MTALDVIELHKSYKSGPVLKGINLSIEAGERVALLAPPKGGKSTLLRILAGLEGQDAGEVFIGGRAVSRLPPQHRNIAFLSQVAGLYPHMTVEENLGFALSLRRQPRERIDQSVRQTAQAADLLDLLGRYPDQLSAPDRVRVALARALIRQPQALLLDEPLAGLSADERRPLRSRLLAMLDAARVTTLYTTSEPEEALGFGGRLAVLSDGRIAQAGPAAELVERPASVGVAALVRRDPLILLAGRLTEDGGGFVARDGTHLPLPVPGAPDTAFGAPLALGFRADALSPDPEGKVRLEVLGAEPAGPLTKIIGRLAGEDLAYQLAGKVPARAGDVLTVRLDPARCHLFERKSGLRLA